jgi:biopolymer transport protein ExbD
MAFRPSLRSSRPAETAEPNMFPMMNLMVVLIPLLLSTASIIKIGIIELNLPPAVGGKSAQLEQPKEIERKLDLAITITDQGFFLSSSLAVLRTEQEQGPSIPMINGEYNFNELSKKLYEIKKKIQRQFTDADRIVIQAEPDINYQILVSTMDAARSIRVEGKEVALFPEVSLSAGII